MADNITTGQSIPKGGLNTDNLVDQIQPGFISDSLNAINSSIDGQQISYMNEFGDKFCFTLPKGYKCIGIQNIMQLSQVWYYLTNPTTGYSLVGYVAGNSCVFTPVIDDSVPGSDLLNFNIQYPIHKVVVKSTNCSTQQYFTDRYNHRRYFDLNDLPWKDGLPGVLDTNKMEAQPKFRIPNVEATSVNIGGSIIEGDYQFAIQYANIRSEGLTSFYSVSNPVRIFLESKVSLDYNLQTNYAISLNITNLDTTRLYDYFNLAVIKTINGNTSAELVGTYYIQTAEYKHIYTGTEQANSNNSITLTDILTQHEYYDIAGDLTTVDNVLVYADLIKEEDISYQKIFNEVKVYWATSQVPVGQQIGYNDGVVCAGYEGYFRDEVYALEGCLLFDNGKQSQRCQIPGRVATAYDLQGVTYNEDVVSIAENSCPEPELLRWKVYNTASVTGPLDGATDSCTGIKPWEYGEMAYYESDELYPNNPFIWGTLAGQKQRHHKFPDCIVSPIHDNSSPVNIYPIGFKVDIQSLYTAIINSDDLTQAQKRSIKGFKIMRSDRAGNESVVAKGWLSNCGKVEKGDSQGNLLSTYYYPNYSFNDVRPDPFISSVPVEDKSGTNESTWLNNFQSTRYTFHSPDTHFNQPSGIQGAYLKLETAEYGICKAHFVKVQNNAGEKLKTKKDLELAFAAGIFSSLGLDVSVGTTVGVTAGVTTTVAPVIAPQNFFPAFNTMMEIIDKLIPWYNYGWQYNAVGTYDNSIAIPNDVGNKIRYIKFGGYINSGVQSSFGDDHSINNSFRESAVYLSINEPLPYTHNQVDTIGNTIGIPQDTSRVTASQVGICNSQVPFYRDISVYYSSIKRYLPSQYGSVFSYRPIDTGVYGNFFLENGDPNNDLPIVYGGDCFINQFAWKIKHSFFLKSTVGKPDGYDIDYNQDGYSDTNTGNVGYPIWYYSTDNIKLDIDNTDINNAIDNFMANFNIGGILLNILTGGSIGVVTLISLMIKFINNGLLKTLGLKITNLECNDDSGLYEKGQAYLYSYGIPYIFCESQVNVDMRQAFDNKSGDFYPHVGTDIPDEWLQETNVPIAQDNTYNYNKTYSKQNHETAFTLLRPDWEPGQTCYIDYNNRAIWSDQSSQEETKNNWLVYRPANLYDFPKIFGQLVAIDRLESRSVLVRYQNHSQLYNAMATIDTTAINAALGIGALFSGTQPIDFTIADTGYLGTQNKMLLSTENGHIFIDALRGRIALVRGTQVEELSGTKYLNSKFFQNNLPFSILEQFPNLPIDNSFNGVGICGTYDNFYNRLIITKIDYQPLSEDILWDGSNFYINDGETITQKTVTYPGPIACCPEGYTDNGNSCSKEGTENIPYQPCPSTTEVITTLTPIKKIIELTDTKYFCNKSWTRSFSFMSNSWISPHSYFPNYYIPGVNLFQSGYNSGTADVYTHNDNFLEFNKFRGIEYDYILESPFAYTYQDQLLQYLEGYATVLQYTAPDIYVETDETVYFTQCIVYNNQASTGLLNLIPKNINNRAQYISYPKYNTDSIDVLVTYTDHIYSINMLWNNLNSPILPQWENNCTPQLGTKNLKQKNFSYANKSFTKFPLRAKDCKVRMIFGHNDYRIINRFQLTKSQNMYS